MAHFYGEIRGNRGEATRMGSKDSGFYAHIRGWHVGAKIECFHNEDTGKDEVQVYRTAGSSGQGKSKLIATFIEGEE
jgi:hypothetical protein